MLLCDLELSLMRCYVTSVYLQMTNKFVFQGVAKIHLKLLSDKVKDLLDCTHLNTYEHLNTINVCKLCDVVSVKYNGIFFKRRLFKSLCAIGTVSFL